MKTEGCFSYGARKKARRFGGLSILLLALSFLGGTDTCRASGVTHQIYTPRALSASQVKSYLAQLSLGTASPLPGTKGVLLTGDTETLDKAKTILSMVDNSIPYMIQILGTLDQVRDIPGNQAISRKVGQLDIGTFALPPVGQLGRPALIDIHNHNVIAVAPKDKMKSILRAVKGRDLTGSWQPTLATRVVNDPFRSSQTAPMQPWRIAAAQEDSAPADGRLTDGAAQVTVKETPAVSEGTPADKTSLSQTVPLGQEAVVPDHQSEYKIPDVPNGTEEVSLALPEQVSLVDLLGLVGEQLKLNFVYEPEKLQGSVNVTLMLKGGQRGKVFISELYPLLESVLRFKNFAMTRKGNMVQVVPMDEVMRIDPLVHADGGTIRHGDAVITRIFRLEHITPENAENLLGKMKLTEHVVGIEETKTLIVTAFAFRMPHIENMLELADTPGEPKRFRYRQLQYTMAKNLKEKVKALAEQLGSVEVSISQPTPTVERRRGESEASYQARLRAAQRAASSAAARNKPQQPQGDAVYLDADERTNRILMIGRDDQLDVVDDLIDSLDVEKQDVRILKPYRIENLEATEVRIKLVELGIVADLPTRYSSQRLSGDPRTRGTTTTQPPRTTTTTRPTTGSTVDSKSQEGVLDEPQVVVVEATNSLLVNATPEQHLQITEILSHIDRETDELSIPYRIYPLENQAPEELVAVLEKLILDTVQDKEAKTETKIPKLEDEIVVVADEKSFSLIVYASPKNQEWIASLIETLDRPRPQVLIDVMLVEITKDDEFNYDLDIISSIPDLTATSGNTTGLMGGLAEGVTAADPYSLVQRLTDSGRNRFTDFSSTGGTGLGFYGDKHVNVLLEVMEKKNYGRVLAKPKILVNDGETGTIESKDTTYILRQEGTLNTSATTNVVQTSTNWESYDAGILLEITPNINDGDLLRLEVAMTRSDFEETPDVSLPDGTETTPPPNTTTSDVKTVVTVPDESTIILGGLVKLNQAKGGTKIPILGDLPLIGGLFRSTKNVDSQRHLYVFVKAEVIRPSEVLAGTSDLDRISELHRTAFEEHESEFQMYESWPGIKAQPMGPKKVLDAN